ncbi:MAG: zinc ribbon domain-containing protein [Deltaproteobacteria bacterium]|nr:zinc ribbon domain-containing protein [Deltaproteobacteria bacterium]MBW2193594.1 zinc ribbon domain-containing protein [Deltaproteobacteria bacterium]
MPIYEYECSKCHKIDEVIQKFSDKPMNKCRHCSGKLQKLISQSAFHLKGTGWYVTDYANRSRNTSTSDIKKGETTAKKAEKAKTDTSKSPKTTDTTS